MKEETFYVSLDSTGAGSFTFTARKASVRYVIHKITCEVATTTTGRATLSKNGGFLSEMRLAAKMEAHGPEQLFTSEYVTAVIEQGPPDQQAKFIVSYEEEPE